MNKLKHQKPWYKRRNIKFVERWQERTTEESYLTTIHNKCNEQELLDLHCYMYFAGVYDCLICNARLTMNSIPKGGFGK